MNCQSTNKWKKCPRHECSNSIAHATNFAIVTCVVAWEQIARVHRLTVEELPESVAVEVTGSGLLAVVVTIVAQPATFGGLEGYLAFSSPLSPLGCPLFLSKRKV